MRHTVNGIQELDVDEGLHGIQELDVDEGLHLVVEELRPIKGTGMVEIIHCGMELSASKDEVDESSSDSNSDE